MANESTESSFVNPELPALGLVAEMSREDRAILSSYGFFHIAQQGKVLIKEGNVQNSLYFVISGSLHAKLSEQGHEMLVGSIRQGEWFGEVNIFDPAAASATVVAIEPTQYWQITREDLQEFINNYPAVGTALVIGIAIVLSRRLRGVSQKLADSARLSSLASSFPPAQ